MSPVGTEKAATKPLVFQKVGVFVDAENIEMSSLNIYGGRVDYKKIIEHVGDREITRILYYKPSYKDVSPTFETFWKSLGGELRRPEKNADSFLIVDAVTMAEKLDVAIILGGDKDYLPLVWYLKSRGCRVEVWSIPETTSDQFKEAADIYVPLTETFLIPSEKNKSKPTHRRTKSTKSGASKKTTKKESPKPSQSYKRDTKK